MARFYPWVKVLSVLSVALFQNHASACSIFLVPGAFSESSTGATLFLNAKDYFKDYLDRFHQWGCKTGVALLPIDATIEEQGLALRNQVEHFSKMNGEKVALFAHSQGALDARYALHDLGLNAWVSALVTIGAPHHGTPLAHWAIAQTERRSFYYWALRWIGSYDLKALSFVGEMTADFIQAHAVHFGAAPGVVYASASGVCHEHCHWVFALLEKLTVEVSPGDGIVPAFSQRLGFGQDLGDYDLDHISEVSSDPATQSERLRLIEKAKPFLAP